MHIYPEAADIYPDLKEIIFATQAHFIAVGVSFDRSSKHLRVAIEKQLDAGVRFTYVTLSLYADFSLFAPQFGQTVDELRTEVNASTAALEALHRKYPNQFAYHTTKRCPNYRIYISDPQLDTANGIINFYGSSTDSPNLPAFRINNFRRSPFASYFNDAIRALEQQTNKRVFIVHGHSEAKLRELEALLQSFGLEPIALLRKASGASTIIEKFERYARECIYAIAIFTPDDWIGEEGKKYFQPRPNALFEVGWFSAHLGRHRVLLLVQGEKTQLPSDLSGVVQLRFHTNVRECYVEIKEELAEQEILRA